MDENQYTNGIILCYKFVNNKKLYMPERQTDGHTKSFCQFIHVELTCFAIDFFPIIFDATLQGDLDPTCYVFPVFRYEYMYLFCDVKVPA